MDYSKNFVIKAINNRVQLSLLIFLWILLLAFYFVNIEIRLLLLWLMLCIGLTIWLISVKLIIENGKIVYQSGLLRRELYIETIISIGSNLGTAGANLERDLTIKTSDITEKNIKFNIRYFRKKDIIIFIKNIILMNPNIKIVDELLGSYLIKTV
jgi:hypothetical protein